MSINVRKRPVAAYEVRPDDRVIGIQCLILAFLLLASCADSKPVDQNELINVSEQVNEAATVMY